MPTIEALAAEVQSLHRQVRDLVALSTLPTGKTGWDPLAITEGLAEILLNALKLDIIYIFLDGLPVEVVRAREVPDVADPAGEISRVLAPYREFGKSEAVSAIPNPLGAGEIRLVTLPIGPAGEGGVMMAASTGPDFPTQIEDLLLRGGANQLAVALQAARLVTEHEQVEEALHKSETRFHIIADTVPVLIWMSGPDQQKTYFNQPWLDFTGRTLAQESGFGWTEGIHPDDLRRCREIYAAAFEARQPFEMECRLRRADGEYRWVVHKATPLFEGDHFTGYIGSCMDIHERKRTELAERLLAEAGKVLASSLDPYERLSNVAWLAVPDLADWCAVDLFEEDWTVHHVAVAHIDPNKVELAHELHRRYPPDQEKLRSRSLPWQSGRSELHPEITEAMLEAGARDAEHYQILRDLQLRSAMIVPLMARERVLGIIAFIWAESGRRYDAQDLALAEELARRAAIALDNAWTYASARRARQASEKAAERIAGLQAATAALSVALTPAEVINGIIRQSTSVLGASGSAVMLLTEDGDSLEIVGTKGYSDEGLKTFRRFPLAAPIPASDALRTGEPVWLRDHHEFEARYPHLASTRPANSRTEAVATIPLTVEGRGLGVLAVSFDNPRDFSPEDKDFLETLAGLCAQALKRSDLYEAERTARREAERAREQLSLLAAASEVLIDATSYETAIANLTRLVVPRLADWCVVDLIGEDDLIHRLLVVHRDPDKADLAAQLQRRYPVLTSQSEHTINKMLHRGRSWFDPEVSEIRLAAEARDDEHLRLLKGLGFASEIVVPLIAHGNILGALTLVRSSLERRYEAADLTLAEELASRAAIAVENARLYEAERKARAEAEAAQHSLALLAEARERNRLAQELHDNVAQVLGYLNLKMATLQEVLVSNRLDEVGSGLSELKQIVGEAYTDIRGEIFNLRATPSDEIDFLETLRRYVDKYKRFYQLDIQLVFEVEEDLVQFPAPLSIPLIRTIQEALINVRKHAQVKKAVVRFSREGDQLQIRVEDDGKGFDPAVKKASSFGLKIMRERVENIGCHLEIESAPGQGTRVTLLCPAGEGQG